MLSHAEFVETEGNLQQAMTRRWGFTTSESQLCARDGCRAEVKTVAQPFTLSLPLILVVEASSTVDLTQLQDASPEEIASARAADKAAALSNTPSAKSTPNHPTSQLKSERESAHDMWKFPAVLSIPMSSACFVLVGEVHHSTTKSHYHSTATPPGFPTCFPHDGMVANGMISPQDSKLSGPGKSDNTTHAVYMLCQGAYPEVVTGVKCVQQSLLDHRKAYLKNEHGIEVVDLPSTRNERTSFFDYKVTQPGLTHHASSSDALSTSSNRYALHFLGSPIEALIDKTVSTSTSNQSAPKDPGVVTVPTDRSQATPLPEEIAAAPKSSSDSVLSSPTPPPSQFQIPGFVRLPTPSPMMFACICGVEGTYDTMRADRLIGAGNRVPLCSKCLRRSHGKCSTSKNYPTNSDTTRTSGWICQLCQNEKDKHYLEQVRQECPAGDEESQESGKSDNGVQNHREEKTAQTEDDQEALGRAVVVFYQEQKDNYSHLFDEESLRLENAVNHAACEFLMSIYSHASLNSQRNH